ncbi:MAG: type II toxin-antitoxin system MqsA family antitoxin [Pseudohongiellaceae bacterium]
MAKRDLFTELKEGFDALGKAREGKITLKTHDVQRKAKVALSGKKVLSIRKRLNMSQAVFASALGIEKRTLERWEQGQGVQGAPAMLIKLVEKYPDTLDRVAGL